VIRAASAVLAAVVLVPTSAGAGTTRPPLALTATPAYVSLSGSARSAIRVTNTGSSAVVVDVGRAGFSLDLHGRPRIVARGGLRGAGPWLTVTPRRLLLAAGATRWLSISSRLPAVVEPGDHDTLVLLTTRPQRRAGVAVRMRIGVVVVVRAPGQVVRRLAPRGLHVRHGSGGFVLELDVVNSGSVTETLGRGQVRLTLRRGTREVRLRAEPRGLRPRTSGLVQFRYRGRLRGWVTAYVAVSAQTGGPVLLRTFRVRL
jgi:hypothetical protein